MNPIKCLNSYCDAIKPWKVWSNSTLNIGHLYFISASLGPYWSSLVGKFFDASLHVNWTKHSHGSCYLITFCSRLLDLSIPSYSFENIRLDTDHNQFYCVVTVHLYKNSQVELILFWQKRWFMRSCHLTLVCTVGNPSRRGIARKTCKSESTWPTDSRKVQTFNPQNI